MENPNDEIIREYITQKFLILPNLQGTSLEETPLLMSFSDGGDSGNEIATDKELLEIYGMHKTSTELHTLIEEAYNNHAI